MPFVSRLFVKTGMVFFMLALVTGLLLELGVGAISNVRFVFWHMLMLGWITQIIIGVSLWMFPGRSKYESMSNQIWAYLTYFSLNIGLVLRIIAEPQAAYSDFSVWSAMLLVSAVLQSLAPIFYVREMWPRLRPKEKKKLKLKRKRDKRKIIDESEIIRTDEYYTRKLGIETTDRTETETRDNRKSHSGSLPKSETDDDTDHRG